MHIRSALLGFSLAGLFPLAGHTAFVDEGESFTDTDTGLRWVKATTTRGMTVEEVRAEMNATGQFAACRWPTGDEVQELFDNLGLPPSGTPVAGQDAEDLEFAIALLGDTLDGYLDNRADEDDVSPTGAGWTKANFGRSLLSSSSSGTILLRDGELVSRADGTPVSDGADEVFVSVPYGARLEWRWRCRHSGIVPKLASQAASRRRHSISPPYQPALPHHSSWVAMWLKVMQLSSNSTVIKCWVVRPAPTARAPAPGPRA